MEYAGAECRSPLVCPDYRCLQMLCALVLPLTQQHESGGSVRPPPEPAGQLPRAVPVPPDRAGALPQADEGAGGWGRGEGQGGGAGGGAGPRTDLTAEKIMKLLAEVRRLRRQLDQSIHSNTSLADEPRTRLSESTTHSHTRHSHSTRSAASQTRPQAVERQRLWNVNVARPRTRSRRDWCSSESRSLWKLHSQSE